MEYDTFFQDDIDKFARHGEVDNIDGLGQSHHKLSAVSVIVFRCNSFNCKVDIVAFLLRIQRRTKQDKLF